MGIIENLFIELKKQKRRHNLLIFVAVILAEIAFLYGNYHNKEAVSDGWMILFYNILFLASCHVLCRYRFQIR